MKFHLGEAPETVDIINDSAWKLVAMPEVRRWQIMAFPVAIINMAFVAALWLLFTPAVNPLSFFPIPIIGFVLCLVGVLVIHELIHSFMHPKAGFSQHSIIGFYPSRMLLYSVYNGEVTKGRFVTTLMMPFICISIIPILISSIFQTYSFWVAYITVLNAFVAAGDIMEICTVLRQAPRNSSLRRNGWSYYWKSA